MVRSMDLLTNAVESLQVGLEDYQTGTRPRLLSAVRNIHAGILLLYKEALRRESPKGSNDALLMANIIPVRDVKGNVTFVGEGRKTVDFQQIRERFSELNIHTDWKRFEKINDARNDVEHRYARVDRNTLAGLISDSFLIVRDFITDELADEPHALLGEKAWKVMLDVAEVYEKEKKECDRLLALAKWPSPTLTKAVTDLVCGTCGSDLLRAIPDSYDEVRFECVSCGAEETPQSYVPRALSSALYAEAYIAMTDGGDPPCVNCPECGEDAYILEEDRCAVCQARVERTCRMCGEAIPAEELDTTPLCGYCHYRANKDD